MHSRSKASSKVQSHKLICVWSIDRENQHTAGMQAAGAGEKIPPTHDSIKLQVCPLQQSL